MKRSRLAKGPGAVLAIGVLLGRAAQADTVLTFDSLPPGQANKSPIIAGFGSDASASSAGIDVTGLGTPHIGLAWGLTPGPGGNIEWDYYIGGPWAAAQLKNSDIGATHTLTFTTVPGVGVQIDSFNFHPYYNDGASEHFDYTWSVVDGGNTVATGTVGFDSDATKNHPVDINYTGPLGDTLLLEITRTGGNGNPADIAVDDIHFNEVPEPGVLQFLGSGLAGFGLWRRFRKRG